MDARKCDAGQALAQNALEMAGVVRLEQLGRARQIKIIQARHPETVRACPQHVAPMMVFFDGERTHGLIRAQHRLGTRVIELAGGEVHAPVVDGHRHVEQPLVAAGEVKIEEAAEPHFVAGVGRGVREHRVVAEQIGVARAFGHAA